MAILDPLTFAYWTEEERLLWEAIAPLIVSIYYAGGESGIDMLPAAIQQLMNWDLYNQAAIDFLHKYRLETVVGITKTTRNQAIAVIDDWLRSGDPLPVLQAELTPIFGVARVENIAVTEVTRIFARGNRDAWRVSGLVSGQMWNTARDEDVCPLCGPLAGNIISIDDVFVQTVEQVANSSQMRALVGGSQERALARAQTLIKHSGTDVEGPPRHPRCRCWPSPIVSEELLEEALLEILA